MLVVGISFVKGISKKTQQPYESYVLHGIVRRFNGDIQVDSCWISVEEFDRQKITPGDIVRIFRDGGVLIQDHIDIAPILVSV